MRHTTMVAAAAVILFGLAPSAAARRLHASLGGHRLATPAQAAPGERASVLGGETAPQGSFGWMAFVNYHDPSNGESFSCSGTVIAPDVVLTAGHCAEDPSSEQIDDPAGYTIVTNALDWTRGAARAISGVSRIVVNPDFDATTLDGDAALLVLSSPTSAPTIPLATTDPTDLALINAGSQADIAGWGETTAQFLATQLQWGVTTIQRPMYCSLRATADGSTFDAGRQLCTLDAPTDADGTCKGDSGGPLLAMRPDQAWVEIGIASTAASNCNTAQADFFTRADSISAWAAGWIAAVAPAASARPDPPAAAEPPALAPLPGRYRGRTSQHARISLRITAEGKRLMALSFRYRLRCTRHRPLTYSFAPVSGGRAGWPLSGMSFDWSFRDRNGERYLLTGTFTSGGDAAGTLKTVWSSRRYGTCTSGLVRWRAAARS